MLEADAAAARVLAATVLVTGIRSTGVVVITVFGIGARGTRPVGADVPNRALVVVVAGNAVIRVYAASIGVTTVICAELIVITIGCIGSRLA